MRALVFLLAIAACSDEITIEVVVPDGSTATHVQMFLAVDPPCTTLDPLSNREVECPGIGPQTDTSFAGRLPLEGEVFFVDDTRPFVAPVESGSAWFRVDPTDEHIPVVIAVGTGPNGPESVIVVREMSLADGPIHLRVQLAPAGDQLVKASPSTSTNNALIWPDASPDREDIDTCVGVEYEGKRTFVVPIDNPDCDDVSATEECNKLVHDAIEVVKTVDVQAARCSFEKIIDTADPTSVVCELGGQVCNEAQGGGITCANDQAICISNAMCGSCPQLGSQCVIDTFKQFADPSHQIGHIECDVSVQRDMMSNHLTPCTTVNDVPPDLPGACVANPQLSRFGFPFDFMPQLLVDSGNGAAQITLFAEPIQDTCNFKLHHQGAIDDGGLFAPPPTSSWISLMTATHTIVLPLVIKWTPVMNGCTAAVTSSCVFRPGSSDNIERCFDG